MSTLVEIEEAIKALPADQVAELACWLDDIQSVNGVPTPHSGDCLVAQIGTARRRMRDLETGKSEEIPGETAHEMVRKSIARRL